MAKVIKKTKPAPKKAPAKKAVAKPAPKKAPAKKAAAKVPAKAPAKVVKKAAPAKKAVKPVAKAKPAAKKVVVKAKPVAKKVVKPIVKAKPVAKKVVAKAKPKAVAKPAPKKAAVKATPKVVAKVPVKAPAKKVVVKEVPKKVAPKVAEKPAPKPVVKAAPKKAAPAPEVKTPTPKPVAKPIQKTPVEMAHQISSQRHSHDVKPLMDVTVTRYKDADLAIFKEVILKKIAKAKEEIDFYTDQIKNTSESETQFASIDDGSMTSERENMNQIVVRMQKLISHLESALVRIENKSYGICRETGKLIPKERLMVVPHATLSVEGKKLEKK
jgi:RNA polymerase-binding transcription factor DksA